MEISRSFADAGGAEGEGVAEVTVEELKETPSQQQKHTVRRSTRTRRAPNRFGH